MRLLLSSLSFSGSLLAEDLTQLLSLVHIIVHFSCTVLLTLHIKTKLLKFCTEFLELDWNFILLIQEDGRQKLKASQALLLSVAHQTLGVITVGGMHDDVKSVLDYRWHMEF